MSEILLGVIIAIAIILIYERMIDNFQTKNEKAAYILNWWNNNDTPTYKEYKREVPNSDIVEYIGVKKMMNGGNDISSEHIKQIIS